MKIKILIPISQMLILLCRINLAAEAVTMDFTVKSAVRTQFGSNIEVNDNRKTRKRLFDERILDRSFEATAQLVWVSTISGATANITQDCTQSYADRCSVKADITAFSGGNQVAFVQTAVWLESGKTYIFSFWAKQTGYGGSVTASIIDSVAPFGAVVQSSIVQSSLASGWTKYSGTFIATQSKPNAFLVLQFNAVGTVWIDELSLTPASTVSGMTSGLYSTLSDLGAKVMRFPGGSESNAYDWKKGIGSHDARRVNVSVMNSYTANVGAGFDKVPYYNDFGTDEFLQLADAQGWTPIITLNFSSGPTVAAQWVEYCNGAASTTYGAQRAANGHPAPYNVKYWEVGNEIWNQIAPEPGAIPNAGAFTQANTDNYITQFRAFSDQMKVVDPTIFVGAIAGHKPSDSYMTGLVDPNWNEDLLSGASDKIDFISMHIYATGRDNRSLSDDTIYNSLMGSPLFFEEEIQKLKALIAIYNPQIKIAVTEFSAQGINTTGDTLFFPQTLEATMFMASMKNVFLRQGVTLTTQWDLLNESYSLLEHSTDTQNNAAYVRQGPFHLETLYKDYLKATRVDTTVQGSVFSSVPVGWMRAESSIPMTDALASVDDGAKKVSIILVNKNKVSDSTVELDFNHFFFPLAFESGASIVAGSVSSRNTAESPSQISKSALSASSLTRLSSTAAGEPRFNVTLPKASVTAVQFAFSQSSIQSAKVYPNPYRPAMHSNVTISPIPGDASVKIYTETGDLIRELSADSVGEAVWNGLNSSGGRVSSGIYLALIQSSQGKVILKMAVQN